MNKKIFVFPILVCLFVLGLPGKLMAAVTVGPINLEFTETTVASHTELFVTFDITAGSIGVNEIVRLEFPFGWELGDSYLGVNSTGENFIYSVDFQNRKILLTRDGSGGAIGTGTHTISFRDVIVQPKPLPIGDFAFAVYDNTWALLDEDFWLGDQVDLDEGEHVNVHAFTRDGAILQTNQDFEIRFGIFDHAHNHYKNASITSPSFTPLGGTGNLTVINTTVSNGIMTATLRYDKEEKIAIEVDATFSGNSGSGFLGQFYFVHDNVPPAAPGTPVVCAVGEEREDFIIQWRPSPTPGVTYEVWHHYSEYQIPYQQLSPGVSYNDDFYYAEFRNGTSYHRYFPTFTRAYGGYNQWVKVLDTVTWGYTGFVPSTPPWYGDYFNYSEFSLGEDYPTGPVDETFSQNWFQHPYGAFRLVAVNGGGSRSLSTAEMVRAPLAQDGVFDPQPLINQPPENVVVFNEGNGNIRVVWDHHVDHQGPSGQIFKWYVYRKVVNTAPGIFNEYQEYSYFTFVDETYSPDYVFPIGESYPSFHEYSSLSTLEPYGIFKVVGVTDQEWLTSTSSESRTIKYAVDPGFGQVSLDIVNYPPNPVTTDNAIDLKLRLVDALNQVVFDDNSSILDVWTHGMTTPMPITAVNGVFDISGLRQFITGDHVINCQLVGQAGPGTFLSLPYEVTADATRIIVVFDDVEKIVAGPFPYLQPRPIDPRATSDFTVNIEGGVQLYAVDNYNNIDPNFNGTVDSVGFGPWINMIEKQGADRGVSITNGVGDAGVSMDAASTAVSVQSRLRVTIDTTSLFASDGITGDHSSWCRTAMGVRVVHITFDDVDNNGDTDSVIVSFDTPLRDFTVQFDDSTSPPSVSGWSMHRPGEPLTGVRPDDWHSNGPVNDTQIMLIFEQDQSAGTTSKDLIFYQELSEDLRGTNGGLVYNVTTWDNAMGTGSLIQHNAQSSVVTSAASFGVNSSGHVSVVTMDFSGPIGLEYYDPNRWFVIGADGVVLTNLGVSVDNTANRLTVTVDGSASTSGQPDVGLVDFNFNFIPQGLIAVPGQTSAGAAQIDLFWNPIFDPNLQQYLVFRSTGPTGPWSLLTETTQTLTSDAAISTGTTYYYHLRSFGNGNLLSLPSATVFASVQGSPPTATASATPTSGTAPLQVVFSGTGTDTDGTIVAYEWDANIDDQVTINNPNTNSPNFTFTYHEPGSFTARLKVRDNDGNTDTAEVTITVTAPASGPTANATLSSTGGPAPLVVTFSDTSTAGSDPIAFWQWDFDADGIFDLSSTLTGDAVVTYRIPNQTYSSVKLRVTDTENRSSVKTFSIQVGNATNPPLVTLDAAQATGPDGDPISPTGSLPYCVTFDAATYDGAGGNIVRWEWDFNGDGFIDRITTRDDGVVTHCFVAPGSYSSQVRVMDTDGLLASDSSFISVATPTNANIFLVEPVTLDLVGGTQIPLVAETVPNSLTSTVLFEASTNGTTWTQVGTTQTGVKFEYVQPLALAGYADGPIYLRARCTDINSGSDTSPVVKVFKVPAASAKIVENINNGLTSKEVSFDPTLAQDIKSSIGAGLIIPLGAISDDATGIGGLRCVISEKGSGGASFSATGGLPQSGGAPSIENLGRTIAFDINLGNGGEVNVPSKPLTLTIPYPDANNDGIVDGTNKQETELEVWYYDEITGNWKRTISTSIDTENNILTVTVAHLTDFGMFATVVSSALGGGAGVPGGATAGAGLCLVSTPMQVAAWILWILGLLAAGWFIASRVRRS